MSKLGFSDTLIARRSRGISTLGNIFYSVLFLALTVDYEFVALADCWWDPVLRDAEIRTHVFAVDRRQA